MKKKILIVVACILAVLGVLCGIYFPESELNNSIDTIQNIILEEINETDEYDLANEVIVSEETEETVIQTLEAIENGEDLSTTEELESSEEEEQLLEEEALESDAQVEQENIAWERKYKWRRIKLIGRISRINLLFAS